MKQLKPLDDWNLDYVRNLSVEECDWLDFKESRWLSMRDKLGEDISKYVSAFANYSGGYLIVGCKDSKPGASIVLDEGVDFSMKGGLKGWLEDFLPHQVDPPISQLNIKLLPLVDDLTRGVVVIRIDASRDAPHQAIDKKFYQRVGSKQRALGTQHILDIRNRIRHPEIVVTLKLSVWRNDLKNRSNLMWAIENTSNVMCRHYGLSIFAPADHHGEAIAYEDFPLDSAPEFSGRKFSKILITNGGGAPLFPQARIFGNVKATYGGSWSSQFQTIDRFVVRGYADSAPPKLFEFIQDEIIAVNIR